MTKKILVLHTGGTISMSADDDGKVSQNADNPMNHVGLDLDQLDNMTGWLSPTEQIPWKKQPTS